MITYYKNIKNILIFGAMFSINTFFRKIFKMSTYYLLYIYYTYNKLEIKFIEKVISIKHKLYKVYHFSFNSLS